MKNPTITRHKRPNVPQIMPIKTKPIIIPPEQLDNVLALNEIRSLASAAASGIVQGKDSRWVGDRLELIELKLQALREEF